MSNYSKGDVEIMTIGEKISVRRKELGLTLEDVGKYVGVTKATVKKWETGYIANMRRDKIALLAKILKIPPTEFINENEEPEEKSNISYIYPKNEVYSIPLFESVSAGFGAYADSEVLEYIPIVLSNPHDAQNTIAIKVKGDSMYPLIMDGDCVIVRKQDTVVSGTIGVVLLDDNEALVKRIVFDKNWMELQSVNPQYAPKRFENDELDHIRIVGKVIKIDREL